MVSTCLINEYELDSIKNCLIPNLKESNLHATPLKKRAIQMRVDPKYLDLQDRIEHFLNVENNVNK